MSASDGKTQLIDQSRTLQLVDRVNTKGSAMRQRRGLWAAPGRLVNMVCARGFDLYVFLLLASRRLSMRIGLSDIASRQTRGVQSDSERATGLTHYVFDSIAYARSVTWLQPADTVRLGFGDCKCQARLLQELFTLSGLQSRVTIGVVGKRTSFSRVHAWVEVKLGDHVMVCDPTFSPKPLSQEEYDARMGGVLDVTPEYTMKRCDLQIGTRWVNQQRTRR